MGVALRGLTLLCVVATVGCASCATVNPPYDYYKESDPRKTEYVLGPSDVLRINVWKDADLSGEAVVRPDGAISLPLIGDIRAAGRTPTQVRVEVSQRLATFIKDQSATVTVAVVSINSYRFTVSGMVEHPGSYAPNHYVTVSEAIVLAGGPNKFASPEKTRIIRQDPTTRIPRRIPIDYPGILAGQHPEQDLVLVAGDNVYVSD